jgi:hypothetical protein
MKRSLVVLTLVAAVGVGLTPPGLGQGQERGKGKLSAFMRPKLEHSKGVLEGLALENYGLIAKNAQALKELSEAAEWKVSPNVTYLRYSGEFQRLADELIEQAKKRDNDAATLAYVQLTINCVKCHKYVRQNNLISVAPRGDDSAPAR